MENTSSQAACPYCQAEIDESARKCRFCGEWVRQEEAFCRDCGTAIRAEWARRGICAQCELSRSPSAAAQPSTMVIVQESSGGNVLAAVASFFIPGLGQLAQGRLLAGVFIFFFAGLLWVMTLGLLGWVAHLIACLDAALYKPRRK